MSRSAFANPARATLYLITLAHQAASKEPWVQAFTLEHSTLRTQPYEGRKATKFEVS